MSISNPNDRKIIRDALQEISNCMTRVEAERDLIKDIKGDLHEQFKEVLSKKQIARMARIYHKQNFNQEQQEFQEFENLYAEVVQTS